MLPVKATLFIDPAATVAVRASSRSATTMRASSRSATITVRCLSGLPPRSWACAATHYAVRACPGSLPSNSRSASALLSAETKLLMLPHRASTSAIIARAAAIAATASASALAAASSATASLDALATAVAVSAAARSRSSTAASSASCRRRVLEATEH
ncbi:uncharacterized protein [Miscanthus floridulus]|uniref:uncharacterized protein n=1 Tax=Miscanthus floridulus TaxID=154761 RepID=UPI00345A2157